ncbi:universal stress protein [Paraburkholderia silviterrae]|uniref:Universal stress protein n=1 Tax=Paraburkholderia silviterrae TaxID=2528715 RepID=A0A4R5MH01_9BURK|nr:universal stress protein [Paraburkholderia silviterrae]TDG26060.1 universal stress protein [Paraburkholderia silviterrae]
MYTRVLVPVDGSEAASRALDAALELAVEMAAELRPFYVIDVPVLAFESPELDPSIMRNAFAAEGRVALAHAEAQMRERNVAGSTCLAEISGPGKDIAHHILLAAADWRADLIVMGTHGRRGLQRLILGSVAERVLRGTTLPVLLVPARARAEN